MGRQIRAARVYQTAKAEIYPHLLDHLPRNKPAWWNALIEIPPSDALTRTLPPQHTPWNLRGRKPQKVYRPTRLVYPEDKLRNTFYRDHPWELARPKMLIEFDGQDMHYRDWSKGLRQPGMPLSGECVVQRQLWLMENEGMKRWEAYDKVRKEFYRLRHLEEITRRVAQEEARMVGGYFGMTHMRVGMMLEDKQFETWKKWAATQNARTQAMRSAAYTSFGDADEHEEGEEVDVPS